MHTRDTFMLRRRRRNPAGSTRMLRPGARVTYPTTHSTRPCPTRIVQRRVCVLPQMPRFRTAAHRTIACQTHQDRPRVMDRPIPTGTYLRHLRTLVAHDDGSVARTLHRPGQQEVPS
jgi:hypothetical protein